MKIRELLEARDYDPVVDSGMSDWDYADSGRRRGRPEPDDDLPYRSTSKIQWKKETGEKYGKPYTTIAIVDELDYDNRAWLSSLKDLVTMANVDGGKSYYYYNIK